MQKLRIFQVLVVEILNAIDQNAAFVVSETLNGIMGRIAKPI